MTIGSKLLTLAAVGLLSVMAVGAAVRTHIALNGVDASAPKPGLPTVQVHVTGGEADRVTFLADALGRDLRKLVILREPEAGEIPDFDLRVVLGARVLGAGMVSQPFEVALVDHEGRTVWRTTGRTESDNGVLDPGTLQGTGRNIISALIHDGWLEARIDPDDLPPSPPSVGLAETAK